MNGWKLREQLNQIPELSEIPVILLSGIRDLEKKASSLGATESFAKPYNIKALIDTVQRHCHREEDWGTCRSGESAGAR
jgi:PleD family two-component response regulator